MNMYEGRAMQSGTSNYIDTDFQEVLLVPPSPNEYALFHLGCGNTNYTVTLQHVALQFVKYSSRPMHTRTGSATAVNWFAATVALCCCAEGRPPYCAVGGPHTRKDIRSSRRPHSRIDSFRVNIVTKNYKNVGLEGGHAVALWLRHYTTDRKVAGAIPDEVKF
jgi:hypothetical protein